MAKKTYRVLRGTLVLGKPGSETEHTANSGPFEADEAAVARAVANGDVAEVSDEGDTPDPSSNAFYGLPKGVRVEGALDARIPLQAGEGAPTVAFGEVVARAYSDFDGNMGEFNKADQGPLFDAALEKLRADA